MLSVSFFSPEQCCSTWLSGLLSWHFMRSTELDRRSPGKDLLRETPMHDSGEGVKAGEDDLQMVVGPDLWRKRGKEGDWTGRVRDSSRKVIAKRRCLSSPKSPGSFVSRHGPASVLLLCWDTHGLERLWEAWPHKHFGGSTRAWQEPLSVGLPDRGFSLYMLIVVNKEFATEILKL